MYGASILFQYYNNQFIYVFIFQSLVYGASILFQYYNNQKVMELAIPAVVRFLDCDNKDLCRSVASYLSLAAIESASLLAQHMPLILASVLKGILNS